MHSQQYYIAAAVATILIGTIPASFAQGVTSGPPPPQPITVVTNKAVYTSNDTITVSGKVGQLQLPIKSISLEIIDPQGGKLTATAPLSGDGTYRHDVNVSSAFHITGEYRVIAFYGDYNSVALFMVIANPYILTIDGKSYPIDYTIESGLLTDVIANVQEKSLVLHVINSTKVSKFAIELPRGVIDSQNDSGDAPFTVFINNKQTQIKETASSGGSRTLEISLPYEGQANPSGTWDVKIIGSRVIPEFGSLALIILGIGGIASLIAARKGDLGVHRIS